MMNHTWNILILQLRLRRWTTLDVSYFVVSTLMTNHTWCLFFYNWRFVDEPHLVHILLQLRRGSSSFVEVALMKNHTGNIFFWRCNFDKVLHLMPLLLQLQIKWQSHLMPLLLQLRLQWRTTLSASSSTIVVLERITLSASFYNLKLGQIKIYVSSPIVLTFASKRFWCSMS